MDEKFCNEGLVGTPGSFTLTEIEGRIVSAMLEQVIAGGDISSYAEEAQVILGGLRRQLEERQG